MLAFKEGVLLQRKTGDKVYGISPEIVLALQIAEGVWEENGVHTLVVTSLLDGTHSEKSLHYVGKAVDLRTKGTGLTRRLVEALRKALPLGYDLVLEDENGGNEHCHVEWDFKG